MPVPNNSLRFVALDSTLARALRDGAADANGQVSERQVSDGGGNPCRHCLDDIAAGAPLLVLAHRPFPAPQPYAELGPKIGRASCRERVCQYVYISGVGGSLKT